jgi:hypothetical protein
MNRVPDIHVHVHIHEEPDSRIDEILLAIGKQTRQLYKLTEEEKQMALDLSGLTVEVTNNTDVVGSALALIQGLADELTAAAGDPAAVAALADTLRANNQALADAVAANTPVAPPTA